MNHARAALAFSCWAAIFVGAALAQTNPNLPASPPLPPTQAPAPPPEDALPPYEPQLERLAELMGTLAYLRDLCGKGDGAEWRSRMSALLDAEAKTPERRQRLAGAYNRGFHGYEATYRFCTPAAELVIARFLVEGDRLARELSARFGGT